MWRDQIANSIQGWGFGALRFMVRTGLEACRVFLEMGVIDLATSKLEKCQDVFLVENILGLYVAVMTTHTDFKLNNPIIIREVMKVTSPHIRNGEIVRLSLTILILSCKRTQVYSHVITAYGAKKLLHRISTIYRRSSSLYSHIHMLCKQLLECMCSCCSKSTSVQLINDQLVLSQQHDPGEF